MTTFCGRMTVIFYIINFHFHTINMSKKYTRKYLDKGETWGRCIPAVATGLRLRQRLMGGYKYRRNVLLREYENAVAGWFYVQNCSITSP